MRQQPTCAICRRLMNEYGHNARPVAVGRCCTDCNRTVVQVRRFALLSRAEIEGVAITRNDEWRR
jgi:hypothetical protein